MNESIKEVRHDQTKLNKSQKILSLLDTALFPFAGKIEINGSKNLKEILKNESVIFATTHLSDQDVTLAVREYLREFQQPFLIARASTHNLKEKPFHYVSEKIFGGEYFVDIATVEEKGREKGIFSFENFMPISEEARKGKNIFVAGFYISDPKYCNFGQVNTELPPKIGVAAPVISLLSGKAIIPVTVDMGKGLKPETKINFGEVIRPSELSDEDKGKDIKELLKDKRGEIREMSDQVAKQMAAMLPAEKRGVWGQN